MGFFRLILSVWACLIGVNGAVFAQSLIHPEPGPHEITVEKNVMVPMRDGVRLATDIYFPSKENGTSPTIIIRLPYNKETYVRGIEAAKFFATRGYRVLVQDMRGKWASEGKYRIFAAERNDGYDFIDWIVQQPWSNGKVGSFGCSYLGENQILLAAAKHPAHKAMIAQAAGGAIGSLNGSYRYFGAFEGGAFSLSTAFGWFPRAGLKNKDDTPKTIADVGSKLYELPVIDLMRKNGVGDTDWDDFLRRAPGDPWWREAGYITDQDTFDVPALHVNSWYDFGTSDTLILFNRMQTHSVSEKARQNQFAIVSPAGHCMSEFLDTPAVIGELAVGDASFPYWEVYKNWFDHWLLEEDNGVTEMPKVQYFVTGGNEWKSADQWPPAGTETRRFYLHSNGKANSLDGDGVLSLAPAGDQKSDRFVYDPADPVPSKGGTLCCTGNPDDQPGIFDQSDIQTRDDVLVYTTAALSEPMTLAGPMRGVIHVSSSAKDTDFTLKLVDVWPDGKAYNIQDTILRARYREGYETPVWMKKNEIYRLELDLHDMAYHLPAGHKLRLEVSSSNFPRYDRNLNTGGPNYNETKWVKAVNDVHHNERHPSYISVTVD